MINTELLTCSTLFIALVYQASDVGARQFFLIPLFISHNNENLQPNHFHSLTIEKNSRVEIEFQVSVESNAPWAIVIGKKDDTSEQPFTRVMSCNFSNGEESCQTVFVDHLKIVIANVNSNEVKLDAHLRFYICILQPIHHISVNGTVTSIIDAPIISKLSVEDYLPGLTYYKNLSAYATLNTPQDDLIIELEDELVEEDAEEDVEAEESGNESDEGFQEE